MKPNAQAHAICVLSQFTEEDLSSSDFNVKLRIANALKVVGIQMNYLEDYTEVLKLLENKKTAQQQPKVAKVTATGIVLVTRRHEYDGDDFMAYDGFNLVTGRPCIAHVSHRTLFYRTSIKFFPTSVIGNELLQKFYAVGHIDCTYYYWGKILRKKGRIVGVAFYVTPTK